MGRIGKAWARITGILVLTILLTSGYAGLAVNALGPGLNEDVIDGELQGVLARSDDLERVEVIIQFKEGVLHQDEVRLNYLGFEVRYRYHVLPAVFAVGTVGAIKDLSLYHRTFFIENNTKVQYDMEMGTHVINATLAWTTQVNGIVMSDPYIDGEGVTAVIVDTGIDAGHPDMDYRDKTILNLYLETEDMSWKEAENTDLYYGHGTHVAGTVAGNGDASAGARRGVAPGANLIGVTIWDPTMMEYLVAEEWVYDHSRPNNDPYNIRVATNSWHTIEDEYVNESALSQIINKLTYDNNVITTWSAGNEGRTDPEGTTVTTSIEGNTPIAIMVAAYQRDGSAVTDFSSRGEVGKPQTYPDIGAPGRSIWSTSARRTVISGGTYFGGNTNPYYLAISGTSMSTPHVCGLVALLWQAAPSAKVSERHEDFLGTPEEEEAWLKNPYTRIHEIEWILEATATYLPPSEDTGVFVDDNATGADGQPIDYAQGYGIVNAEYAVGVALTLEKLRTDNPYKDITVADALRSYHEQHVLVKNVTEADTDVLSTMWDGEYSRYNDQYGAGLSAVNQTKFVWAPKEAETVIIDMDYAPLDQKTGSVGDITFTIDYNGDGNADFTGPLYTRPGDNKHVEIPVSEGGRYWTFDVIGQGFRFLLPRPTVNYVELRIEYHMGVQFIMRTNGEGGEVVNATDYNVSSALTAPLRLGSPSLNYQGGSIATNTAYYDLSGVTYIPEGPRHKEKGVDTSWGLVALLLMGAALVAFLVARKKGLFRRQRRGKT